MITFLNADSGDFHRHLAKKIRRQAKQTDDVAHQVQEIMSRIRNEGDAALIELTQQLDQNPIQDSAESTHHVKATVKRHWQHWMSALLMIFKLPQSEFAITIVINN